MALKTTTGPVPQWIRPFFSLCALLLFCTNSNAQLGFVMGPYFVTPNFGSVCYGQDHDKIGNNQTIGGFVHLNFARKLSINASHFQFAADYLGKAKPHVLGYNVGGTLVYDYIPIQFTEFNFSYAFHVQELSGRMDFWGGDKLARSFGIRAGGIQSQRLVQIKPTRVNYSYQENGNTVQAYDYVSWYDVTGVKQTLAFAGVEIDKYKSVEQYRNPFNRFDPQQRKRMYQQYFDVFYAAHQEYADYGVDSFSFRGNNIPDISHFGWRLGLRRVTYNHLAHSFVFECGQFPGQKRIPDTSASGYEIDQNPWKNWFVFVGFHLDIGHWFGDYE